MSSSDIKLVGSRIGYERYANPKSVTLIVHAMTESFSSIRFRRNEKESAMAQSCIILLAQRRKTSPMFRWELMGFRWGYECSPTFYNFFYPQVNRLLTISVPLKSHAKTKRTLRTKHNPIGIKGVANKDMNGYGRN